MRRRPARRVVLRTTRRCSSSASVRPGQPQPRPARDGPAHRQVGAARSARTTCAGRRAEWLGWFTDGRPAPQWLPGSTQVREVLTADGRTLAQGALGWLGPQPGTVPIPGLRTVAQAEENFATLELGSAAGGRVRRGRAAPRRPTTGARQLGSRSAERIQNGFGVRRCGHADPHGRLVRLPRHPAGRPAQLGRTPGHPTGPPAGAYPRRAAVEPVRRAARPGGGRRGRRGGQPGRRRGR